MDRKQLDKKNRQLILVLIVLVLLSLLGAIIWFSMYAPLVLNQ
jgi:hypothetical protein